MLPLPFSEEHVFCQGMRDHLHRMDAAVYAVDKIHIFKQFMGYCLVGHPILASKPENRPLWDQLMLKIDEFLQDPLMANDPEYVYLFNQLKQVNMTVFKL